MTGDMLFGWTCKQWDKAETYYNLCNPGAPVRLVPFYQAALRCVMRRVAEQHADVATGY